MTLMEVSRKIAELSAHEYDDTWWGNDTNLEMDLPRAIRDLIWYWLNDCVRELRNE